MGKKKVFGKKLKKMKKKIKEKNGKKLGKNEKIKIKIHIPNLGVIGDCEQELWLFKAQPIGRKRGRSFSNFSLSLLAMLVDIPNMGMIAHTELEL